MWLNASGSNQYQWSNGPVGCDTCAQTYMVMNDSVNYLLLEGTSATTQWATNGTFSSGNSGFITNYTHNATSIWNEGTYAVGPNPNSVHPNFGTWGDHTTGTGNYMLVNGATSGNKVLWRQINSFPPGAVVTLKFWTLTFVTPATTLRIKHNGTNVGALASTPGTTGTWAQTTRTFTVPGTGTSNVAIITTSSAVAGNDFGLDDISFSYTCTSYDTLHLVAKDGAKILLDSTELFGCDSVCFALNNLLDTNAELSYLWVLSSGTYDSTHTFQHCLEDTGTYTGMVYSYSTDGCTDSLALPHIRVAPTRRLDSIQLSGGFYNANGVYILNSGAPCEYSVYFHSTGHHGDSLFVDHNDGTSWSAPPGMNSLQGLHQVSNTFWPSNDVITEICAYYYTFEGCVDSICKSVAHTPDVQVPNFITPNGDNVNDQALLQYTGVEQIQVNIHNRWGKLIFSTTDKNEFWNGTTPDGQWVADGVYFISIVATNSYAPEPFLYSGAITVMNAP